MDLFWRAINEKKKLLLSQRETQVHLLKKKRKEKSWCSQLAHLLWHELSHELGGRRCWVRDPRPVFSEPLLQWPAKSLQADRCSPPRRLGQNGVLSLQTDFTCLSAEPHRSLCYSLNVSKRGDMPLEIECVPCGVESSHTVCSLQVSFVRSGFYKVFDRLTVSFWQLSI